MTGEHTAGEYYRACAAEMMAKAQSAPSKAIRQAYLNLALNWAHQAADLGVSAPDDGPAYPPDAASGKKI